MHGAGNDYVYVDLIAQPELVNHRSIVSPASLAVAVSDRRTGIGSDGLVLISQSPTAAARMRMFNADGSEAEMCGNALRCVARLLFQRRHVDRDIFTIETGRGDLRAELLGELVRIEMGRPILSAKQIPTTLVGNPPVDQSVTSGGRTFVVTCVSMGNPHCVVFCDELSDEIVLGSGPEIEQLPSFPNRTNVEFVTVVDRSHLNVRVWERGSGETQACGTGACAAVVAGVLSGRCERIVCVTLPGGTLEVDWTADSDNMYLTGPAVEVFCGEWLLRP
jgi:diaminopimelate epimerase